MTLHNQSTDDCTYINLRPRVISLECVSYPVEHPTGLALVGFICPAIKYIACGSFLKLGNLSFELESSTDVSC